MKKWGVVLIFMLLVACSNEPQSEEDNSEPASSQQQTRTIVENLNSPWDIEFHASTFYISEREGSIVSWSEENGFQRMPVQTDKGIVQIGEGGLLGLHLHPDFSNNQRAYAYHTYQEGEQVKNRLILVEKRGDRWEEVGALLENIPGAQFHNGGRVEIGPDGKLYVTTGDSLEETLAQDLDSLAGKVLRLNTDGSIPADNPFQNSYIYSYGHRNPQGLAWSEDGKLYASEHGPDNHDELNQINPGSNYGWPIIVGDEQKEGMVTPLYQTGKDTWAPSGMASFNEELYIASLRGTALRKISYQGENPQVAIDGFGRIRDVEVIDQQLYFITNNTDGRGNPDDKDDRLVRFTPS